MLEKRAIGAMKLASEVDRPEQTGGSQVHSESLPPTATRVGEALVGIVFVGGDCRTSFERFRAQLDRLAPTPAS